MKALRLIYMFCRSEGLLEDMAELNRNGGGFAASALIIAVFYDIILSGYEDSDEKPIKTWRSIV